MIRLYKILPILLLFLLFFITPRFTPSKAYAAIVINELFPKNEDQWVELYNTGDASVSLDRWTIQNISGETKTFILNASANLGGHGFYVIHKSQSGISLSADGDAIKLVDDKGTVIDLQGFPGILGYNTAWGRAPDGTGLMTGCTNPTPNATNDCPVPTPTPTPPPATPSITPAPTAESAPPVENVSQITNNPSDESIPRIIRPTAVLGSAIEQTPTPTLSPDMVKIEIPNTVVISKLTIAQIGIILGAWALLATVAFLNKWKLKRKKKPPVTPPPAA